MDTQQQERTEVEVSEASISMKAKCLMPDATMNAEENFQQGDIRAFFKRAGRTEIKEVKPETENVYLDMGRFEFLL